MKEKGMLILSLRPETLPLSYWSPYTHGGFKSKQNSYSFILESLNSNLIVYH